MQLKDYLIVAIRIFTILPLMHVATLLMGKRTIGELPVFDFLVVLVLGAVVGADIADPKIHHGPTVMAIVLIALLSLGVSWLKLRSLAFRRMARFEPTVVIENGRILKDNLRQIKYSLNQILEFLRLKGVFSIAEVEYALVESDGQLSVLRKSQQEPPKANDLNVPTPYRGLPTSLIYEGNVDHRAMNRIGLNRRWLDDELARHGVTSVKDVFYAELDTSGRLYISLQNEANTRNEEKLL